MGITERDLMKSGVLRPRRKLFGQAALELAKTKLEHIRTYIYNETLELSLYYNRDHGWIDYEKGKSYQAYRAAYFDIQERLGLIQGNLDKYKTNWLVPK